MRMIKSVICFLVNKPFNLSVVFIYISIKILVLILVLRFPSIVYPSLSCSFCDQPHCGYLSLGYRRYLFSALHLQGSA